MKATSSILEMVLDLTVKEVIETARKVTGKPIKAVEEGRRAGESGCLDRFQ